MAVVIVVIAFAVYLGGHRLSDGSNRLALLLASLVTVGALYSFRLV